MIPASVHRWSAVAAAVLLLCGMVTLSRDFGFTWDERFQQHYGERVWDYYHGRLPRTAFDTDFGNEYLYGGLVEVISVGAQHALRHEDVYVVRHMVDAVFGWMGIVFCGLLAARAFGRRAGWIAAVLLTVSPRWLGDAMNNPKDAPFAALTMAALYFALTIEFAPPHWPWRRLLALLAAVVLAVNVRPLGLVLLGFAGAVLFATATWWLATTADPRRWRTYAWSLGRFALCGVLVVPLGTIAWPWAQGQPLWRPIEAFLISTRLNWASDFSVLYDGQMLAAGQLPWHYIPRWLFMALPPVVVTGVLVCWLALRAGSRARFVCAGIALFVALPISGAIWRHATIYDGIRHILFVVPPLTMLAAGGWQALLSLPRRAATVSAAVLAIGIAEPMVFQIRNHPNQIVYFSPLAGGPSAAFGRFDMDYWGNCMLEATTWSASLAESLGRPLGVSGNPFQAVQGDTGRYHSLWATPAHRTDYALMLLLLRGSPEIVRATASRPDALYRVTMADGTPLCVVVPGPAFGAIAADVPKVASHRP